MIRITALFCLLVSLAAAQSVDFYRQLTPAERQAAGIAELTPAQQAALDSAVARFAQEGARQEVEVVKAKVQAETATIVQREVETVRQQVRAEQAAAVQQAREQAKAEVKAEVKRKKLADAGLQVREDDETIRTKIAGKFNGWEGATVFTLENGQVWQQTDKENRFFPTMLNPDVELVPHRLFGWKLKLVSEGLWVRVRRIK